MEKTKENVLMQMERVHDEIKRHPFRTTFAKEDIAEYKLGNLQYKGDELEL